MCSATNTRAIDIALNCAELATTLSLMLAGLIMVDDNVFKLHAWSGPGLHYQRCVTASSVGFFIAHGSSMVLTLPIRSNNGQKEIFMAVHHLVMITLMSYCLRHQICEGHLLVAQIPIATAILRNLIVLSRLHFLPWNDRERKVLRDLYVLVEGMYMVCEWAHVVLWDVSQLASQDLAILVLAFTILSGIMLFYIAAIVLPASTRLKRAMRSRWTKVRSVFRATALLRCSVLRVAPS